MGSLCSRSPPTVTGGQRTLPTPSRRAWPRKEFKARSVDPAASMEAGATQGRVWPHLFPSLPLITYVTSSVSDARICPLGSCEWQASGFQNRRIPAFVRGRGASCGSLASAQDRKGIWASPRPVCLPPRVLPWGQLGGPRGRGTTPRSRCPLQGLSFPKDRAEAPQSDRGHLLSSS